MNVRGFWLFLKQPSVAASTCHASVAESLIESVVVMQSTLGSKVEYPAVYLVCTGWPVDTPLPAIASYESVSLA